VQNGNGQDKSSESNDAKYGPEKVIPFSQQVAETKSSDSPVQVKKETNGHDESITISHTNGHASESSEPNDTKYGPEKVIPFSQQIAGTENSNSPVQVKDETKSAADAELQELAKLKFDIKKDGQDEVQVTSALRSTE